jgi:signal transduction histidine kinase
MTGLCLLSALVAVALGLFVWSRAPRHVANLAFAWGMLWLAAADVAQFMLTSVATAERDGWLRAALVAGMVMLPGWAVFGVTFARSNPADEMRRWRWPLAAVSTLAALAVAAAVRYPFAADPTAFAGGVVPLTAHGHAVVVATLLGSVLVLFELESTFRASAGTARWRMKYLLLGLVGLFGVRIFILSDVLLVRALRLGHLPLQSATALLGFGLIGVALVRHRLLAVDVFVSRHAVYRSIAVAAVGAYLLTMGVAAEVIQRLEIAVDVVVVSLGVFVTAMALLVGLVSERVRRSVKRAIARHFYRHKYDYRREWTRFTSRLALVLTAEEIASRLLATVEEVLDVRRAALFVARDDGGFRLIDAIGRMPSADLGERPAPGSDEPWSEAAASLGADGFTWVVPLLAKEEVLGLLAMAPRHDHAVTDEDADLVTTLVAQAATALLNARLAEQLAAARELEALHRVSAFVLHDLKNCASMLAMVSRNAEDHDADPDFRRDARVATAETARTMRTIIERLSHLPKDADLRLTPMDLNDVVREAVDHTRPAASGVRLSTELASLPPIAADRDEIRRVVDNLLVNAVEALAGAGDVRVRTAADERSVWLEVSDDGPGVEPRLLQGGLFKPFVTTKPQGLGIGLYQVKSILTAHGADIDVASREGHGTTVRVRFPMPTERTGRDGQN